MSLSAQLYVWPTSSSTLREVLGLDPIASNCCHGTTKKRERCKLRVDKTVPPLVSTLLSQVVKVGSFEAAKSLLCDVSRLVMCKAHHQNQSTSKLELWGNILSLCKNPVFGVKKEEEEGDAKVVLASLTTRCHQIRSQPLKEEIKSETDSPNETSNKVKISTSSTTRSLSKPLPAKQPKKHVFEPWREPLSTAKINQNIKNLILRPLTKTEKDNDGLVYVYIHPDNYHDPSPYIKIGYTKNWEARQRSFEKRCGYKPRGLALQPSDSYVKVEKLVHAALRNKRMWEAGGCPACEVKHCEWFDERSCRAANVIVLWATWMRLEPYAEGGELKEEWVERLGRVDLRDANCWEEFAHQGA